MGLLHQWNLLRVELTTFSRLWEDCAQEEARLTAREEKLSEEKLSEDEEQALEAHFKKRKKKKENHSSHEKFQKFEKGKRDFERTRLQER